MIRILGEHTDVAGLLADAAEEGRTPVLVEAAPHTEVASAGAPSAGADAPDAAAGRKGDALDAFAAALGFPDWWGRNLDAFADCLDDYAHDLDSDVELVWDRVAALRAADPGTAGAVVEILTETQERYPRLHVTVVER